jgi:hypothetical protein
MLYSETMRSTKIKNIKDWQRKAWIAAGRVEGTYQYVGGKGAPVAVKAQSSEGDVPKTTAFNREEFLRCVDSFDGNLRELIELVCSRWKDREAGEN